MFRPPITSMLSLALSLSSTLDLVSPQVVNHHRRVALIAYLLGVELNLPFQQRKNLLLAGIFHDIGAFSLRDRINSLAFEMTMPHEHAEIGYLLLKDFEPLSAAAEIVRFHHVPWDHGYGAYFNNEPVPEESHIIHLADRISILIPDQLSVLGKAKDIFNNIKQHRGTKFRPDLVDAFASLANKEFFWLDIASAAPTETLQPIINLDPIEFDIEMIQGFSKLFSQVIDFRCPFTATHSSGVAATAEALAQLAGFSEREMLLMRVAGHLHDLGKLAVPASILEKPDKLSSDEWDIMRTHSFHGFRALQKIPVLETVNLWASLHHERLDGSGYPFHLHSRDLPLGSRILAVADIFTALAEDRPYRAGLAPKKALEIVCGMARDTLIDSNIVHLLKDNLLDINQHRQTTSAHALETYRRFEHTTSLR